MRPTTYQHLCTAREMPKKRHPLLADGLDVAKAYRRRAKRERNAIAKYYRWLRAHPEEGSWSVAHRYGVVVSGQEARRRLKIVAEGRT